jgi:hypothetical protein
VTRLGRVDYWFRVSLSREITLSTSRATSSKYVGHEWALSLLEVTQIINRAQIAY